MTQKVERVMLVGPRSTSNVVSGMRIGFDLLIAGFEERKLPHVIVNRSMGMSDKVVGTLTLRSIFANIYLFLFYWINLFAVDTVYMTIGTSRFGFLRDAVMIWSACLLGKRNILHLKGGGFLNFYQECPSMMQWLLKVTFARVDTIIVLGNLLVDQFSFVPGITEKLQVVPNGLPKELQNNDGRSKSLSDSATIKLLYLSNMIPSKGYLHILEACRLLQKRGVPVTCDFCGSFVRTVNDGENSYSEQDFHKLIAKYNLGDMVKYHGTVRGNKKQQFFQEAHLFLLPTSYPWEGQPISIIEALAFGVPVISTEYRGIPEQVINRYNGYLVSANNPLEIVNAIEYLWQNPHEYEELSKNALKHFEENFTQEAHLKRLIPILIGNSNEKYNIPKIGRQLV